MPRNVSEDEVKLLGSAGERFAFADLEDDEEEDEEVVWDAASGAARLVRPNGSGATGSAGFVAAAPTPSKAPGRMPPGKAQHWDKLMLTACLCMAFFGLGMVLAMLGPTLLDLGHQVHASVKHMAYVFTARSTGYLFGSMVGGDVFDRFQSDELLLAGTVLTTATGAFFVPLAGSVAVLGMVVVLQGLSMGFLDTGGNVLLLRIWGEHCGPWMQTLHFSFGLGAFVSPLMAKHFIGENLSISQADCGDDAASTTAAPPTNMTTTLAPILVNATTTTPFPATTTAAPAADDVTESNIKWAYWICTMILVPIAIWFVVLSRRPKTDKRKGAAHGPDGAHGSGDIRHQPSFRAWILGLSFVFLFVYVGLEVGYGGFVFAYAVKYCPIQLPESKAAYVTSVYWGFFALGRFLAIGLSTRLSPTALLSIDLVGCILSSILLLAANHSVGVLWVGSAIFGISMASIFPTMVSLAESYIELTGRSASLIVIGAALGEMIFPLLTGTLFESSVGPLALMWVTTFGCVLAAVLFAVLIWRGHRGRALQISLNQRRQLRSEDVGADVVKGRSASATSLSSRRNGSTSAAEDGGEFDMDTLLSSKV